MSTFSALYERAGGTVEVRGTNLVFTGDGDGHEIVLPLSRLQISLEGVNGLHFYFFDSIAPTVRICVQDRGLLELLAAKGLPSSVALLQASRRRSLRRRLLVASPFLAILALLAILPIMLSLFPGLFVAAISPAQEKAIGQVILPLLQEQHSIQRDHPAQPQIEVLVNHLKASNPELQTIDFDVFVSTSPLANAFAAPGNIVVVNRGLIDEAESLDEVMGVLAHELAHIEQKHVLKSLASSLGSLTGTLLLTGIIGPDGAVLAANAADFVSLKYSRDDESAADRRGLLFLQRAGISPDGLIRFFQRLAAKPGLPGALSFLSTHPDSEQRAAELREISGAEQGTTPPPLPVTLEELRGSF